VSSRRPFLFAHCGILPSLVLHNLILLNLILLCFLVPVMLGVNAYAVNADFADYRGMDFTLSYPMQWHISIPESCSSAAGNFSMEESGEGSGLKSSQSFAIYWMKDPGIEPEEILDQMQKNYDREGVSITSSDRKTIKMAERTAEVLSMTYEFRDSKQKRIIAA